AIPAASPDGKHLALFTPFPPGINLIDAATGKSRAILRGHAGEILRLAFTPDGKRLASVSVDSTARLWDVAAAKPLCVWKHAPGKSGYGLAASPDGRRVATGAMGGPIRVWDSSPEAPAGETDRPVAELKEHVAMVTGLAYSPDGRRLASVGMDGRIRLW